MNLASTEKHPPHFGESCTVWCGAEQHCDVVYSNLSFEVPIVHVQKAIEVNVMDRFGYKINIAVIQPAPDCVEWNKRYPMSPSPGMKYGYLIFYTFSEREVVA